MGTVTHFSIRHPVADMAHAEEIRCCTHFPIIPTPYGICIAYNTALPTIFRLPALHLSTVSAVVCQYE
jgi:hypothetical protein